MVVGTAVGEGAVVPIGVTGAGAACAKTGPVKAAGVA